MDWNLSMTMAIDPVCGMQVDKQTTTFRAEHNGEIYYFCSRGCMLEFEEKPEKYLAADHEPEQMGGDPA
jgi:YHS domain-containing protein